MNRAGERRVWLSVGAEMESCGNQAAAPSNQAGKNPSITT